MKFINDSVGYFGTYFMSLLGFWANWGSMFKAGLIFLLTVVLLGLQIYLHIIKIRKEKNQR